MCQVETTTMFKAQVHASPLSARQTSSVLCLTWATVWFPLLTRSHLQQQQQPAVGHSNSLWLTVSWDSRVHPVMVAAVAVDTCGIRRVTKCHHHRWCSTRAPPSTVRCARTREHRSKQHRWFILEHRWTASTPAASSRCSARRSKASWCIPEHPSTASSVTTHRPRPTGKQRCRGPHWTVVITLARQSPPVTWRHSDRLLAHRGQTLTHLPPAGERPTRHQRPAVVVSRATTTTTATTTRSVVVARPLAIVPSAARQVVPVTPADCQRRRRRPPLTRRTFSAQTSPLILLHSPMLMVMPPIHLM